MASGLLCNIGYFQNSMPVSTPLLRMNGTSNTVYANQKCPIQGRHLANTPISHTAQSALVNPRYAWSQNPKVKPMQSAATAIVIERWPNPKGCRGKYFLKHA